jgi:hypothetical protein
MDDLFQKVGPWGAVVIILVYIVVKELAPRINRAVRHHGATGSLAPPPAPKSHHSLDPHEPSVPAQMLAREVAQHMDRFELALEAHFENDKRQFELLRTVVAQMEIQGHMLQEATGVLQEIKGAIKVFSNTQDALLRHILDTGRVRDR